MGAFSSCTPSSDTSELTHPSPSPCPIASHSTPSSPCNFTLLRHLLTIPPSFLLSHLAFPQAHGPLTALCPYPRCLKGLTECGPGSSQIHPSWAQVRARSSRTVSERESHIRRASRHWGTLPPGSHICSPCVCCQFRFDMCPCLLLGFSPLCPLPLPQALGEAVVFALAGTPEQIWTPPVLQL